MKLRDRVRQSVKAISDAGLISPGIGIILGSGLQSLLEGMLSSPRFVLGGDIPGFPVVKVSGQTNRIAAGLFKHVPVMIIGGRKHIYEGAAISEVVYSLLVLHSLGAKGVIITNAAGAVNPQFQVGQIMIIRDHIDSSLGAYADALSQTLIEFKEGSADEGALPMERGAYDQEWLRIAERVNFQQGFGNVCGTYCMNRGPFYETPFEVRACRIWGADAVGMSTVPEAIAARRLGMKVLGLSLLTNMATGLADEPHTHEKVRQRAEEGAKKMQGFLGAFLDALCKDSIALEIP